MRWIYPLVVVMFAAAVLIFVVQNFTMVTMSFLGFSARAPVALRRGVEQGHGAATSFSTHRRVHGIYCPAKRG